MTAVAVLPTSHETEYGHNWAFRFQYRGSKDGAVEHFENMKRLKLDANGWAVTGFRDFEHNEGTVPVITRDYFAWRFRP